MLLLLVDACDGATSAGALQQGSPLWRQCLSVPASACATAAALGMRAWVSRAVWRRPSSRGASSIKPVSSSMAASMVSCTTVVASAPIETQAREQHHLWLPGLTANTMNELAQDISCHLTQLADS